MSKVRINYEIYFKLNADDLSMFCELPTSPVSMHFSLNDHDSWMNEWMNALYYSWSRGSHEGRILAGYYGFYANISGSSFNSHKSVSSSHPTFVLGCFVNVLGISSVSQRISTIYEKGHFEDLFLN